MEPADFYTGIVADLYGPLKSVVRDPGPYLRLIAEHGEPALELGCGDGEPLVDLRRHGLDVDGVDSSADMLERCRRNAAAAGVTVDLHHQRMEALDLPRRYRTIFLAGPTFTLLPDDDTALLALRAIRAHLTEDGVAVVPLSTPAPTPAAALGRPRETTTPDGAVLRFTLLSEERDEQARTQRAVTRYERRSADSHETVDRPWLLHWYPTRHFHDLAATAGLHATPTGDPDPDGDVTFLLRRRP